MELTVKPNTGLYKGGAFKFSITVPPEYNNVPPIVKWQNSLDGYGWMPTRRIRDVILGLDQLFTDLIDFDDPLNAQAAQQWQTNKVNENAKKTIENESFRRDLPKKSRNT
ncbi:hypothetical protein niasHT_020035 [Heterodera trifolii]|uniref:UBC core domain-containing protein n=1 Tax=Heterodera trifolii TaxID=157864 RepID=A0ABD2L5X4_9BILA